MRFGTPVQTVLLVGAAMAASMPAQGRAELQSAKAVYYGAPMDEPAKRKGGGGFRPSGYAKQRREAKKRRRRAR